MCPKVCLALGISFYAKGYFVCRTSRPFFLPSTPDLSHPKKVYAHTSVSPHGNGAIGFFEVRRNMGIFTLKASFTLVVILMPLEIFLKNQTAIFELYSCVTTCCRETTSRLSLSQAVPLSYSVSKIVCGAPAECSNKHICAGRRGSLIESLSL